MQFCRAFSGPAPETAIYGYAKLLSMDEKQVRSFVTEDCMDDLEAAHRWFSENKLDLNLIKSGLSLIVLLIPKAEVVEKEEKFNTFLNAEQKNITSGDILQAALEQSFVPFATVFSVGNELSQVFAFQAELKEKYASECKGQTEKREAAETAKGAPENKSEAEPAKKSASEPISLGNVIAQTKSEVTQKTAGGEAIDAAETAKEDAPRSLGELSRKYRDLSAALLDVVKGQDQAIVKFVQGYNQGELLKQTEKGNHPKTYFFFFGPPGVGKTLLAETAANALNIPHKIYNMSEYATPQSYENLIGTPTIYNNAKEGNLVKFVRENPECLLIFDEVEKAHLNVIRQFLQILGAGKLHNAYRDDDTSFKDATIIFTSNVGKELYADRSVNLTTLPEKVLVDAIQKEKNSYGEPALPPEICSRIASGNTVMFNHLSVRHLAEMVKDNFDKIVAGMEKEYGVTITYAKELPLLFIYNRGGEIDARVAVGQSGRFFKNEIYELLRQLENKSVDGNKIREIQVDIDWKGTHPELKRLFKSEEKSEVLVFSGNQNMFSDFSDSRYEIHRASTLDEAKECMKNDIAAVYIDPFFGTGSDDETILSISDYNTDGAKLFHSLMETQTGLPVFLLEMDRDFSEVDRRTFLQEGAAGTAHADSRHLSSFHREFCQIMDELYMERESQAFSQRGWVIDFNTKQELTDEIGKVKILFYDLKKRMAVDLDSRGSILSDAERPKVRFADVIGAEKAKEELQYFVNYLQNPKRFLMNGGRAPKGVLLYGPPGTGKTMLARAMAGESDVTFLQTSASEFKNKFVGESEANIRRIFAKAKKYAPAIIFIDEIDAIGKKRTGGDNAATTESMLNALLTEMDGFSSGDNSKPVFVLAATNYGVGAEQDGISSLDDALIRRFDNKIYVDLPKESERKTYILKMLEKKGIDSISEKTAQSIAERTTGQSLAILQNVIDLALRNAIKEARTVADGDLLTALEEYVYGEKKEHTLEYYREVAIHETGHAYLSYISGDKPSYITIESRGNFGGYMQHANQEDVTGYTREELLARIRTSLAGRAAEQVFFGKEKSLNTGASSDLQQATEWAWRILCTYGMEEDQLIVLRKDEVLQSPMASEYVAKVNEILKTEMKNTVAVIMQAKDKIQNIADVLIRENRLTGAQFEELMEKTV